MRYLFSLASLTAMIMAGYLLWGAWQRFALRRNLLRQLQAIETGYQALLQKRLLIAEFSDQNLLNTQQAIVQEALVQLKPSLVQLLSAFHEAPVSQLPSHLPAEVFPNLLPAYKLLARQHAANSMGQKEQDAFLQAVSEAIQADISRRVLQLQAGN